MLRNVANQRVTFSLFKSADRIANPTIAVGDFKVDIDGAGQGNVTTPPTSDAAGLVTWLPSAAETNGTYITLLAYDVAGAEWEPLTISWFTTPDTSIEAILADTGTDGVVLADDAITAAKIAADAITSSELAASAIAEIADGVWDELMAGHTTSDSAGYYLAKIGSTVVLTNPVASSGDVTLFEGDDYYDADDRSLEWVDTDGVWPTLTGASIMMYVRGADGSSWSAAGTVVVAVGANKQVRVELSAAQTTALVDLPRPGTLRVRATLVSGHVVTLVSGWLTAYTNIA